MHAPICEVKNGQEKEETPPEHKVVMKVIAFNSAAIPPLVMM